MPKRRAQQNNIVINGKPYKRSQFIPHPTPDLQHINNSEIASCFELEYENPAASRFHELWEEINVLGSKYKEHLCDALRHEKHGETGKAATAREHAARTKAALDPLNREQIALFRGYEDDAHQKVQNSLGTKCECQQPPDYKCYNRSLGCYGNMRSRAYHAYLQSISERREPHDFDETAADLFAGRYITKMGY